MNNSTLFETIYRIFNFYSFNGGHFSTKLSVTHKISEKDCIMAHTVIKFSVGRFIYRGVHDYGISKQYS